MVYTDDTFYTIGIALQCLNISKHLSILLGKGRTLLECADGTLSKKWSGLGEWTGLDTPKTVMTTRAPAALKSVFFPILI